MTVTTPLGQVLRDQDGMVLRFVRTYADPVTHVWGGAHRARPAGAVARSVDRGPGGRLGRPADGRRAPGLTTVRTTATQVRPRVCTLPRMSTTAVR